MITNERQYKITNALKEKISNSIASFDLKTAEVHAGSPILAIAELEALKSEFEVISLQIREYEDLKSGAITILEAASLEELPKLLIKARIARGLSQRQLSELLGLKEQQVQRYESENYTTASLRRLIEIANALEIKVNEVAELKPSPIAKAATTDIAWDNFPVKEMYLRNWFRGFTGSLNAAMSNAHDLVEEFILNARMKPSLVLHRKRARMGSHENPYALLAWQCRVFDVAINTPLKATYNKDLINKDWLVRLAQESSKTDGPLRAKKILADHGIHLIIEPHLPQTHLDGAALLLPDGRPVIGITLRYDRIDNFWFVLFHELVHVTKHLRKGKLEDIFDDLQADQDDFERETDQLAASFLIPEELWETALPRYVKSVDSILAFAKDINISPAIIAGRIRKEADNYTILNDLVGNGEVRNLFT